ncbi:MAG: lipoyl(octanoyl) transferase LipB [Alphaproteobacteria bacterium]|nr:lipoyl(octanoyl) transferase LipB [Alphaproteobacteria bacterium]
MVPVSSVAVHWRTSPGLVAYEDAVKAMETRVAEIRAGQSEELVWCLEHPPLYTAGTSADPAEVLDPRGLPLYRTGRGGRTTWHGPGQRVAYVMLDLKARGGDVRGFVRDLEAWVIATLAVFGVRGERREGRVGIWVAQGRTEEKIAAIGVRVRRWVSYHGIAINVAPDLSHYAGIVPCGIADYGVTSLAALGVDASLEEVDAALRSTFEDVFARSIEVEP